MKQLQQGVHFGELFIAALQTTYFKKIFEVFKPEYIRKIRCKGSIDYLTKRRETKVWGLTEAHKIYEQVSLEYNKDECPELTSDDIVLIKNILKSTKVQDMTIDQLELEIPINFNRFDDSLPEEEVYILKFRGEDAPKNDEIRENLKMWNSDVYQSPLRNLFRYRQLVLHYLVRLSEEKNVPYYKRKPLIDFDRKWERKNKDSKFGSEKILSKKTILTVQHSLGKLCVQERFKQKNKGVWELVEWSK